ncbi:MAG: DUF998 domain-containing protein [Actinomycetota bacterium]|nr:DUF998 domain-containing protein [Actinomycetota bacterium]
MTIFGVDGTRTDRGQLSGERVAALAPTALACAMLAVLAAHVSAGGDYSSLRDPLCALYWTHEGWLFPAALLCLLAAMCCATTVLRLSGRLGRLPGRLLMGAGTGAGVASAFPADRMDAVAATTIGEVHRWASMAVLVLPLLAALAAVKRLYRTTETADAAGRSWLLGTVVAAVAAGLEFLGGFLPTLMHTDNAVIDALAGVNGLSQRVLAVLMIVAVWQLVRIGRADLPTAAGERTGGQADSVATDGQHGIAGSGAGLELAMNDGGDERPHRTLELVS